MILISVVAIVLVAKMFMNSEVEVVNIPDGTVVVQTRTRTNVPHNLHGTPDIRAQMDASDQLAESQKSQLQKILQLREEMHRRMMDKVLRGIGPDQDMFADMEQSFGDAFADAIGPGFMGSAIQTEWSESSTGRTLIITPPKKDQPLDINIEKGMITIKGKTETTEFSQAVSIPNDCDPEKVKMDQKDGKIVVEFPFFKAQKDQRKPVGPSENDVQI